MAAVLTTASMPKLHDREFDGIREALRERRSTCTLTSCSGELAARGSPGRGLVKVADHDVGAFAREYQRDLAADSIAAGQRTLFSTRNRRGRG